jgi:hydrogenase maturation protease
MGRRVLVIGIGNPARGDDGIGPALAAVLEASGLPGLTVDAAYQLSVEDAYDVAQADVVVFADADLSCAPPFRLTRVEPAPGDGFTSHSCTPGAVLALARERFDARCEAWLLGVRGYEFEPFVESLSDGARTNLAPAVDAIGAMIRSGCFEERKP